MVDFYFFNRCWTHWIINSCNWKLFCMEGPPFHLAQTEYFTHAKQNHKIKMAFKTYNVLQVFNHSLWIFKLKQVQFMLGVSPGMPATLTFQTCFPIWNVSLTRASFHLFHILFFPSRMISSSPSVFGLFISTQWAFRFCINI